MELTSLIISFATLMWYCIDRLKIMWEDCHYGRYITMTVAAIFAFALSFAYDLDIVCALGFMSNITTMGKILTSLLLMGGSSAISEIIERIKF